MSPETLQVHKLRPEGVLPTRGSEWSAGYDLSAAEAKSIPPGGRAVVKTALAIACPAGTYGRVAPRSGLTVKKGIHVGAGVIDADYRGEVGVVLFNLGQEDFEVQPGDRIAQLVLEQIVLVPVQEVQSLDETVRGAGGFGSTGISSTKAKPDAPGTNTAGEAAVVPQAKKAKTIISPAASTEEMSTDP